MLVGGEVQGGEGTRMHLGVAGRCEVGSREGFSGGSREDLLGVRRQSYMLACK